MNTYFLCNNICLSWIVLDKIREVRIRRSCSWIEDHLAKPCHNDDSDFRLEVVCDCSTDGCNGATQSITPPLATLVLVATPLLITAYRTMPWSSRLGRSSRQDVASLRHHPKYLHYNYKLFIQPPSKYVLLLSNTYRQPFQRIRVARVKLPTPTINFAWLFYYSIIPLIIIIIINQNSLKTPQIFDERAFHPLIN